MKHIIFAVLVTLFASHSKAEQGQPQSKSLYQILKAVSCHDANDFRGIGIGESESEALAQARSNMALEHFSQKVESSIQIKDQNINEIATTTAKISIDQKAILTNPQDAKLHFSLKQGKEIGVVACMSSSDAANGFTERQRLIADSIGIVSGVVIGAEHPKRKNEAWHKTQTLMVESVKIQSLLDRWGTVKTDFFENTNKTYGKTKDYYAKYCKNVKLHWNPEQKNLYSDIAFAKLSQKLMIEKSICADNGISLVYKDSEGKCKHAGTFKCSHKPSISIASCKNAEYALLKAAEVGSFHQKEDVALERLQTKIKDESFWSEWEIEIEQWRPRCE